MVKYAVVDREYRILVPAAHVPSTKIYFSAQFLFGDWHNGLVSILETTRNQARRVSDWPSNIRPIAFFIFHPRALPCLNSYQPRHPSLFDDDYHSLASSARCHNLLPHLVLTLQTGDLRQIGFYLFQKQR